MNRKDIEHKEATHDPIFLFQEGQVSLAWEEKPNVECDEECESYVTTTREKEYLDDYDLVARDIANITWRTTGVFATREEGENFGERTSYRYGNKGKGIDWLVFCISLERDSELAKILHTSAEEKETKE